MHCQFMGTIRSKWQNIKWTNHVHFFFKKNIANVTSIALVTFSLFQLKLYQASVSFFTHVHESGKMDIFKTVAYLCERALDTNSCWLGLRLAHL